MGVSGLKIRAEAGSQPEVASSDVDRAMRADGKEDKKEETQG